jgi:hypothetical protein
MGRFFPVAATSVVTEWDALVGPVRPSGDASREPRVRGVEPTYGLERPDWNPIVASHSPAGVPTTMRVEIEELTSVPTINNWSSSHQFCKP